jgi:putative ABC transport system substrate-binding protein
LKRRGFITLLGGAAVAACAWSPSAHPQETGRVARVGLLGPTLSAVTRPAYQIFLSELRKLGFTDGQNLVLDHRRTDEGTPKAFAGANELVAAKAEVLVAWGPEIALQAASATRPPVPIVMMAFNYDPFARGYVKTLAQPGGNITGLFYRQLELGVKQLELLVEAFPERTRLGVLWDLQSSYQHAAVERAAQSMGLSVHALKLEEPYDFEVAFRTVAERGAQMLHVLSTPAFTPHRTRIAGLAIQHRLPTMFIWRAYVEAGGLMSYGVDNGPMWRRAASYVAKILRGAQPADLPIEQTANFEFAINLKTANALGVTLPTSILLRADEVIE